MAGSVKRKACAPQSIDSPTPWRRDKRRVLDREGLIVLYAGSACADAQARRVLDLAAAAPELLAAHEVNLVTLDNVADWLEAQAKSCPEVRAILPHVNEARECTRAAIAKAKEKP